MWKYLIILTLSNFAIASGVNEISGTFSTPHESKIQMQESTEEVDIYSANTFDLENGGTARNIASITEEETSPVNEITGNFDYTHRNLNFR